MNHCQTSRKVTKDTTGLAVRVAVACWLSGYRSLFLVFEESGHCLCQQNIILPDPKNDDPFKPEYAVLSGDVSHPACAKAVAEKKRVLVSLEHPENNQTHQTGQDIYDICPSLKLYQIIKPMFFFRDPVRLLDVWRHARLDNLPWFFRAYSNLLRMYRMVPRSHVLCILYERLVQDPEHELQTLCDAWGPPFSLDMLKSKECLISPDVVDLPSAEASGDETVTASMPPYLPLTAEEISSIELRHGEDYMRLWSHDVGRLRDAVMSKSWVVFNWRDTLCKFSSGHDAGKKAVLQLLSHKYSLPIEDLEAEFDDAFDSLNDSLDHNVFWHARMKKVIAALLVDRLGLPYDKEYAAMLLKIHTHIFRITNTLNPGATQVLSTLKEKGMNVAIIADRPRDEMKNLVYEHDVGHYIDRIITPDQLEHTEATGILGKVLEHLGIQADDMVYVGGDEDMQPALDNGIFCIHLAEKEDIALRMSPPRINTLHKLDIVLTL